VPDELGKAEHAQALIAAGDVALSLQVLQEFYWQATKPNRSWAVSFDTAKELIEGWRRFRIQETTLALLDLGFEIQARHRFSHWDSMIVAAALAQGCDILWSEDMDDGRIVNGMRIANPFK
jgi:predicted nucleic acid-binding protein